MSRLRFAAALGVIFCNGAALVAAAAFTAAAHVAAPRENPAVFATRIVQLIAENRYADAWTSLYPAHQQVAPRAIYVGCERRSPIPGHLASVHVLRVYDAPAALGGGRFVHSEAVVMRIEISAGEAVAMPPVVVKHTLHAVPVHGRWRWILPAWRLEEYRAGHCPGG